MTQTEIYTIILNWIRTVLEPNLITGQTPTIPIIRGETNSPAPTNGYMIIHQPFAVKQYSSGSSGKARKVITGTTPNEVIHGYVDTVYHYQGTLTIEEYNFVDSGDKLRTLLNSLNRPDIKIYFKNSKVSILRDEGIRPIPNLTGAKWTLRSSLDLIILFPDETTYETGFIESVEIDKTLQN